MTTSRLAWVALLVLIVAAYAPALNGGRVWDDHLLLEGNPVIRGDLPWWRAFAEPFQPFDAYYRPLTALFMRGLLATGRGATWPFHLSGLLLHLLTTFFLYRIARLARLGAWTAFAAAALWGLHPALTEAVIWISGLGDVLAACAMAGAALFWVKAWDRLQPVGYETAGDRGSGTSGSPASETGIRGSASDRRSVFESPRVLAALSALCLAAACLAKETAITLVFVLWWAVPVLWGEARSGKWRRAVALGLVPQLVALALYAALRASALGVSPGDLFTDAAGGPGGGVTAGGPAGLVGAASGGISAGDGISPAVRFLLLGKYASLIAAPFRLNLFHWIPDPVGAADPRIWLGLAAVAVFAVTCSLVARSRRRALLGGIWSAATLAPAVLFSPPQTSLFSERYLYIPAFGLALLAGGVADGILDRKRSAEPGAVSTVTHRPIATPIAAVILALLAGSAILTLRRAAEWRQEESLFAVTLHREPRSPAIAVNLGLRLRQAGRNGEAVDLYKRTLALVEEPPGGLLTDLDRTSLRRIAYEEGILLAERGDLEEAERALRNALRYEPGDERAIGTLGAVLGELRRYDEAKAVLQAGLELHPGSDLLRRNLQQARAAAGAPEIGDSAGTR